MAWVIKLAGPLLTVVALVSAGLYLGHIRERAHAADQAEADLKLSRAALTGLAVKNREANAARVAAQQSIAMMEVELEEAHNRRVSPKIVRQLIPDGTSCLSDGALRMLNDAAADSNRAVRAAADGVAVPAK
jgi:hypothetical protein